MAEDSRDRVNRTVMKPGCPKAIQAQLACQIANLKLAELGINSYYPCHGQCRLKWSDRRGFQDSN